MSWLDDAWNEMRAPPEYADPGYPAYYGTATREPTFAPWSAVMGARERIQRVFNLPSLRANVHQLMGVA